MFEAHIYFHKDAPNNKLTLAIIWISFLRLHQHIFRKMRLLLANLLITLASIWISFLRLHLHISRKMRLLQANFLITPASIWISFFRLNQHIFRKMRLLLANLLVTLASADVFTDPAIFERLCHFKNDGVVSCHKIQLFIDSIKSEIMNCRWTISTPWTRQWLLMPAAVLLRVRVLRFFDSITIW